MDSPETSPERRRIEFLAEEYLGRDAERRRRRRHHPLDDGFYEFYESLERLRRANEVLEFLNASRRDPYATIADIADVLSDAEQGVRAAKGVLAETGFLEMLDDHLDTVMRGLDPDGLPEDESAVLEMLGFPKLAAVIRSDLDLLASEWHRGTARGVKVANEFSQQRPASAVFDQAVSRISTHRQEYEQYVRATGQDDEEDSDLVQPRKQRRWWKGLGQIVEGAAISVADAGMAVGAFKFPVSPEVQTYGAVVSVAGGVGKLMNGVGDLWGE